MKPPTPSRSALERLVLKAHKDGKTILQIEQATGLDRETIYAIVDKASEPRHTRPRLNGEAPPEAVLAILDPREREVIVLRYGLDRGRPRTHSEVAERLGLSPSRIRQIEAQALNKLKNP